MVAGVGWEGIATAACASPVGWLKIMAVAGSLLTALTEHNAALGGLVGWVLLLSLSTPLTKMEDGQTGVLSRLDGISSLPIYTKICI